MVKLRGLKSNMRPDWIKYFIKFAQDAGSRSTCIRRTVGAVIVKNNMILSTGYNGVPTGVEHCLSAGCLREELGVPSGQNHELCRGIHAEQNAIIQAAKNGVSTDGADMYCTTRPCIICTKMIINAGIKRVYYINDYEDLLVNSIISDTSIKFIKVKM